MFIKTIKALDNSLMYLVGDKDAEVAAVIDASDANKAIRAAQDMSVKIVALLSTNNRWDSTRANEEIKRTYPEAKVYGTRAADTRAMEKELAHNDIVKVGQLTITAKDAHSFTDGSLILIARSVDHNEAIFTGGTLLAGGCGPFNLHEREARGIQETPSSQAVPKRKAGTAKDVFRVLNDLIGGMPDTATVHPGYDVAVDCLKFAHLVEPQNQDIAMRLEEAQDARKQKIALDGVTLGEERKTNPYLRYREKEVRQYADLFESKDDSPVEVLNSLMAKQIELGLLPRIDSNL
eukprot:TRINITY_DN6353_c0_g1_i1.p1 TRINITY_DN6353_c0_g1~~TRINITY_DN6353_c0_g1_i1.p1  ORF type:complete len:292 (+),score=79.55 TRINITY_DN6353_c0_g1_i1:111-986(+)